jgi:hypothetical protein
MGQESGERFMFHHFFYQRGNVCPHYFAKIHDVKEGNLYFCMYTTTLKHVIYAQNFVLYVTEVTCGRSQLLCQDYIADYLAGAAGLPL